MSRDSLSQSNRSQNPFVILFIVIVMVGILSYWIPPGIYQDGVYRVLAPRTFGWDNIFNLFKALPYGMMRSASLIFLIMIIGGALQIYQTLGVIEQGINTLVVYFGDRRPWVLIAILFCLMSACGGFLGWIEILIPFSMVIFAMLQSIGVDPLIGAGILILGSMGGFVAGPTNFYTVAVANTLAKQYHYLPQDYDSLTGIGPRLVLWGAITLWGILYLYLYHRRYLPSIKPAVQVKQTSPSLTIRQGIALTILFGTIALAVTGMRTGLGSEPWTIDDVSAIFLAGALCAGLIGELKSSDIAHQFLIGMGKAMGAAVVIGAASGVFWLLETNQVVGTVIYHINQWLSQASAFETAIGMLVVTALINAIIPYGAGQVTLLIPLFIPLGLAKGMSLQTIILAHQLGGATIMVWFTYGALLLFLDQAGVSLKRWYHFVTPI